MEKERYLISDAADMVHVETHVLRYWEEELALSVPRNEMGHRYYTRENIREFQKIKELKEEGYQLKAIRMILHSEGEKAGPKVGSMDFLKEVPREEADERLKEGPKEERDEIAGMGLAKAPPATATGSGEKLSVTGLSAEERMMQFREVMDEIVGKAIARNNEELSQTIGREVEERVLKEMNYLFREQEEAQQERYRKLDAAIRGKLRKRGFFRKKE